MSCLTCGEAGSGGCAALLVVPRGGQQALGAALGGGHHQPAGVEGAQRAGLTLLLAVDVRRVQEGGVLRQLLARAWGGGGEGSEGWGPEEVLSGA